MSFFRVYKWWYGDPDTDVTYHQTKESAERAASDLRARYGESNRYAVDIDELEFEDDPA